MDSLSSSPSEPSPDLPPRLPTKFNACVRSATTAKRIQSELGHHSTQLKTYVSDNIPAVREADIVILGCKPYMLADLLSPPEMHHAIDGKLIISICVGLKAEVIRRHLPPSCTVVCVMPSTASKVRESMTVIASSTPPLPSDTTKLVEWIFSRVGKVVTLPDANMDAASALCGSGPAFMALILEAMADGAVAMGISRVEAQRMAAQTMRGAAALVLEGGEHPAVLKDKVSTPGGCTIAGLMVLEEKGVRGAVARAVREATVVAGQLGEGVKNVNGTRH